MENKKRYAVTLDLYMYADNNSEAKEIADKMASFIDNCGDVENIAGGKVEFLKENHDNKCSVATIKEAKYGGWN